MKGLVLSAALLLSVPPSATAATPTLKIETIQPFVVSGSGFDRTERVRVVLSGGNVERLVQADSSGSFIARLGRVRLLRCAGLTVVAVGGHGHRASVRIPRPACLTASRPSSAP
jgi:hypothetical protein